jgi:hypothetical protein
MESIPPAVAAAPPAASNPSPFARAVNIFVRPTQAWGGLATRAQWWFPLTVMMLFSITFAIVLHDRAIMPMITDKWDEMVENGQMTTAQVEKAETSLQSPVMRGVMIGQQAITWPIFMLLTALGIWFGVSFLLGVKMPFRHAFEITTWSSLVLIPAQILTGILAWNRQTLNGVHVGWAVLLPEVESPSKMLAGVAAFLDSIGPFSLWSLVVCIIGAAALSGAPRKNAAWVLSGLYLGFALIAGLLAGMFAPGRPA